MSIKRSFIIGDEWLYYKIYCGYKTADTILTEIVKPLTEEVIESETIDKWFFIRYADPKEHIRLRFHMVEKRNISLIIQKMNELLNPFIEAGLVWKVMLDTYNREIERYGFNTIELAENFFYNDSTLTVNILSLLEGTEGEKIRWGIGLRSIDKFVDGFGFDPVEKMKILAHMRDTFANEFNVNTPLRKQLSSKFRNNTKFISDILSDANDDSEYKPLFDMVDVRMKSDENTIKKLLQSHSENQLKTPLTSLIWSYLHMLNNRLFKSNQRLHEMALYYMLFKHNRSKLARKGIIIKD